MIPAQGTRSHMPQLEILHAATETQAAKEISGKAKHGRWAPPLLTWKKAALARCTGMLWEPPVGMGARGDGRICGHS